MTAIVDFYQYSGEVEKAVDVANQGLPPELEHFEDYNDDIDVMRESLRDELKPKLQALFTKHSGDISRLMTNHVKKPTGRAQKEILHLVRGTVIRSANKYFEPTMKVADKLATHVIDTIAAKKVQKGVFDAVFGPAKTKKIKRENNDILTAQIDRAANEYVVNVADVAAGLVYGGMRQAGVTRQIKTNAEAPGRETGKFFNAVTGAAQSHLFRVADSAMSEAFALDDLDRDTKTLKKREWRWITFFTKSCPDCIDRHNFQATYPQWQDRGLPRTGTTVCRVHCHCVLVPAEYDIEIAEPVKRRQRATIETPEAKKKKLARAEAKEKKKDIAMAKAWADIQQAKTAEELQRVFAADRTARDILEAIGRYGDGSTFQIAVARGADNFELRKIYDDSSKMTDERNLTKGRVAYFKKKVISFPGSKEVPVSFSERIRQGKVLARLLDKHSAANQAELFRGVALVKGNKQSEQFFAKEMKIGQEIDLSMASFSSRVEATAAFTAAKKSYTFVLPKNGAKSLDISKYTGWLEGESLVGKKLYVAKIETRKVMGENKQFLHITADKSRAVPTQPKTKKVSSQKPKRPAKPKTLTKPKQIYKIRPVPTTQKERSEERKLLQRDIDKLPDTLGKTNRKNELLPLMVDLKNNVFDPKKYAETRRKITEKINDILLPTAYDKMKSAEKEKIFTAIKDIHKKHIAKHPELAGNMIIPELHDELKKQKLVPNIEDLQDLLGEFRKKKKLNLWVSDNPANEPRANEGAILDPTRGALYYVRIKHDDKESK